MTTTDIPEQPPRSRRARRIGAVAGAIALVVTTSIGTAWAAATFSDVPEGHQFYDEIEHVAEAGIVTGYEDGTFRPTANVSRQALAAMLDRGLSRSAGATQGGTLAPGSMTLHLAEITLYPQGVPGSTGHVTVNGTASVAVPVEANCPCEVRAWIEKGTTRISPIQITTVADVADESGDAHASVAVGAYREVTAAEAYLIGSNDYTLVVQMIDANTALATVNATLNAVYTPFND